MTVRGWLFDVRFGNACDSFGSVAKEPVQGNQGYLIPNFIRPFPASLFHSLANAPDHNLVMMITRDQNFTATWKCRNVN